MPEKPFRESDYITQILKKIDPSFVGLSKRLSTPQICERAVIFERNLNRVVLLAHMPEYIARQSIYVTNIQNAAVQSITVPDHIAEWSEEYRVYVNERIPAIALEIQEQLNRAGPILQKAQAEQARNALAFLFDPDALDHPVHDALQTLYISLLITTWTAFESMAVDLWEAALNAHPKILADLKGKEGRISKQSKDEQFLTEDSESKSSKIEVVLAQVHDVTGGSYDLKDKMGSLLKGKFRFTSLKETRFAYSRAFSRNYSDIDAALSDTSLDMLYALRNVFAHKAGVSDREYDERKKKYSSLPQVEKGQQIVLDGKTVTERINSVIVCGINLTTAVDNWLSANA